MWVYRKLSNLLSRLVVLNFLVIILVILLAGFSVKNYACFLVNSEQTLGQEFVDTLNSFLWKASIWAFLIAGMFHYVTAKRLISPIRQLTAAAKNIKEGNPPSKVENASTGELKELIESFNSMAGTLHSVQERREEMLRDIAHELRTPLTNINGYLEALHNQVIDGTPELFGSLLEESRRISRIVELITELNAWSDGTLFLDRQIAPFEIDKAAEESLKAFQLKWQDKFKQTSFTFEESVITGNKDGIMQVLSNILQNIIDYNAGSSLEVKGIKSQNMYRISFTHTGLFIDPEKKDLVFERFYRMDASRSTKSDGAGLGLAIARSIIIAHKGKIGLDTDGHLHTFWVELPIKKNQEE